ncbi:hypothetical protein OH799_23850 [Nocardia sp. NBC_00881]|uniref:hypothetical protein n=1 Tax=Nocardia sp. NBC_00881 TaxID=2975995 RepID=UPI00386D61C1|nr:hypothetical protein OH799_23850 [Nocardia sp. NBC_00881]
MEVNAQDMLGLFSVELAVSPILAGFSSAPADRDDLVALFPADIARKFQPSVQR